MDLTKLINSRDEISKRIENLLKAGEFELSVNYLRAIHKYLFRDILTANGDIRTYNIRKKEYVLNGDTVEYPDYHSIESLLNYDLNSEKKIDYRTLSNEEVVKRIASLTSRIWLVHPFCEGNTRTTCVFIENYLRYLGYDVNNDIFKENALYFRNALVVSNYYNHELFIRYNLKPLEMFFTKLLIDHNIQLSLEDVCIRELFENAEYVKKKSKK